MNYIINSHHASFSSFLNWKEYFKGSDETNKLLKRGMLTENLVFTQKDKLCQECEETYLIIIILIVNNSLIYIKTVIYGIGQRCTNPGCQVTMTTEFYMVLPHICGSSVCDLVHVIILVHLILRLPVGFLKFCAPLE